MFLEARLLVVQVYAWQALGLPSSCTCCFWRRQFDRQTTSLTSGGGGQSHPGPGVYVPFCGLNTFGAKLDLLRPDGERHGCGRFRKTEAEPVLQGSHSKKGRARYHVTSCSVAWRVPFLFGGFPLNNGEPQKGFPSPWGRQAIGRHVCFFLLTTVSMGRAKRILFIWGIPVAQTMA